MCSRESICENKKDMDDSGFDMSAQDASMCIQRVNLLDLSDDVLLYILRHCTPRDLKALGYSCPRLGRLVRERSLWRRVDARSEGCTRSRFQWLLENVLHADTQVLLLTGYARDTDGCMGLVDITRKMAEQEAKQRDAESALNGHPTLETITTNLANMRGMERHPARFYISAQRTQLRRHRCSPAWPEDGDGKEEGRAGPQRCIGPQYTVSEGLLLQLAAKCPQLTTLWLEYCNIDCSNTCLGAFPKSLKKLSLRGTKCYNMTFDKSFLFKVQDYLPILESLDVSECEWMDPATMLPLSKMPRLEELVMQDCHRLAEFVAYASLTARYGFKALKSLDLRGSPVGDSEVSALGWLPRLEKLWLSARCKKRPPPHSHFVDDERTDHGLLPEWECQEPDYYKDKSDPFTSIEDIESGMGEPMTSSDIADDEPDSKNDRFRSQDAKGSKEDEKDKKGSKRKPDKGDDDDDTDDNGEPSPKHRRTGVKISFENNTITKRVLPVIQNEDGFCVFDESDEAYNGSGENIVIRNNVNENNADNNNEQRNRDNNITPPNFEFNLINPMGSIDVGNVEIDFSLVNVDDLRENLRNDNNRNPDNANNGNRNDNGVNEGRRRRASDDNRENPPNNDDRGCLVDCIKIDRLIDVSNAACDRQNEVIVIASSSRPTNEPSTSKQADDNKKTENTKKPEPQGYVHFRRFQNPVYVNVNRDESDDNNENEKIKENNGNRPGNDEIGKDCDSKIDDKMEIDENKSEKGDDDKEKSDDAKPGTSDKQINEGASTSKDDQNAPKDKPPADNNPRVVPFRRCGLNNERRREPLPPVQYQIEQRHHVLYVGLGAQLNTYRFPRDSSELLRHLNLARTHLEGSGLVTDFAMRRFGRADGEDVNVIHIGPDGPMLVGQATGSRPDRSSLRFLSVTGYRNITDRSLVHLATAAPNLAFIDFSGTSVTEVGVESFRSLRPDCDIVYSQFNEHWPSKK